MRMGMVVVMVVWLSAVAWGQEAGQVVASPGGEVVVRVSLAGEELGYLVEVGGERVMERGRMGVAFEDGDLTGGLKVMAVSAVERVRDSYELLHGKRRLCAYEANRRVWTVEGAGGKRMGVAVQVSDDGVAWRYEREGAGEVRVLREASEFALAAGAKAWLKPMDVAKTGWERTMPSYEARYQGGVEVGTASEFGQGWCFPGLFEVAGKGWVLVHESGVDGGYCGGRLMEGERAGVYRLGFPQEADTTAEAAVAPLVRLPWRSPWRVAMVGRELGRVVESTLVTDVAPAAGEREWGFVRPGKASWHWLMFGDESATVEVVRPFIDLAGELGWEYSLVDANWHEGIGRERIGELVGYARERGVELWLWYNSNGQWNDAPQGPKDRMHEAGVRREEMAWLKEVGVAGIKVDFFGGDKQEMMGVYEGIFEDAAAAGIMVNCHGATVPRGWQRTWPNVMTIEAVRGYEFISFGQDDADRAAVHACTVALVRNLAGPMDFTPVTLGEKVRESVRRTSGGFDLAMLVVFESGVQHLGLRPEVAKGLPGYVREYLGAVPAAWDETRLVAGYPGDHVVMARRTGEAWYVGGMNGRKQGRGMELELGFVGAGRQGRLIGDGGDVRQFRLEEVVIGPEGRLLVEVEGEGGFVVLFE